MYNCRFKSPHNHTIFINKILKRDSMYFIHKSDKCNELVSIAISKTRYRLFYSYSNPSDIISVCNFFDIYLYCCFNKSVIEIIFSIKNWNKIKS